MWRHGRTCPRRPQRVSNATAGTSRSETSLASVASSIAAVIVASGSGILHLVRGKPCACCKLDRRSMRMSVGFGPITFGMATTPDPMVKLEAPSCTEARTESHGGGVSRSRTEDEFVWLYALRRLERPCFNHLLTDPGFVLLQDTVSTFTERVQQRLGQMVPPTWHRTNPVLITSVPRWNSSTTAGISH